MHQYIVNASIQVMPVVQDRHPYEWVDEAIAIIRASGIQHEVGPFATVVEGTYEEVMAVINSVNKRLIERSCAEWITSVQIQLRSSGDITGSEKTAKFQ
jgi:uncharacterized protein YqgV (UPF0045/DUF77 family)